MNDSDDNEPIEQASDVLRAALKNNASILEAQNRAQQELLHTKEALESQTADLAQSAAILDATLDTILDGIYVINLQDEIVQINQQAINLFSIPAAILPLPSRAILTEHIAQQTTDPAGYHSRVDDLVSTSAEDFVFEFEFTDGRVFERYSRSLRVQEAIVGIVVVVHEITAQKRAVESAHLAQIETSRRLTEAEESKRALINVLEEQRLAEVALHESASRLRLSIDAANIGLWHWSIKSNVTYFSPEWKRQLGYEDDEILNVFAEWEQRIHPDDLDQAMEYVRRCVEQTTKIYDTEFRLRHRDGSWRWIYAHGELFTDENGKPEIMRGCHVDITERKAGEAALRESDARFTSAFENAAIGMALVGLEGQWLKVNPAVCALTGYQEEELMALTFQDITHPEDLDADLEQVGLLLTGAKTTYQMEKRYIHKSGQLVWGLLSVSLVRDAADEPVNFIAQIQDITEQKQAQFAIAESEREQRRDAATQTAILNALPAHIALLDRQGVIVAANETWRQFGAANVLQSDNFCVGQNYIHVCQEAHGECAEEAPAVATGIRRVLNGEEPDFSIEYPCHSSTEKRWFRLMVTPRVEDRREGAVVMHINITDRKLTEEKNSQLNRLYAVSSGINDAIVRRKGTPKLFERACQIAVEAGGLQMAWVGLEETEKGELRPVARWGRDEGYLETVRIGTAPEDDFGRGPAGTALRTGQPSCCNDIAGDTDTFASRTEALERGFHSCGAFPLTFENRARGVLVVYSDRVGFFEDEEITLLNGLAENLAFAIESEHREQARQQAEAALKKSETELRKLTDQLAQEHARLIEAQAVANVGSWETDFKSMRIEWSEENYRIFEQQQNDAPLSHEAFLAMVHPQDRKRVDEAFKASLSTTDPQTIEHRILLSDGRVKVIEERWQTFHNDQGEAVRWAGTSQDITERRHREEEILNYQRQFEVLFRDSPVAIGFGTVADGLISDVNHKFEKIFGWQRREAVNQPLITLGPLGDAENWPTIVRQALRSGRIENLEMELYRRSGESFEALVSLERVLLNRRAGMAIMVLDVTDRNRAQRESTIRAQHQSALATISRKALTGGADSSLFEDAVQLVAGALDVELSKVLELLPDRSGVKLVAGVGWQDGLVGHAVVGIGRDSQAGFTLKSKTPVVVEDLRRETRFSGPPVLRDHGVISGISVVIGDQREPWGVFGAHDRQPRVFTPDEISFLQSVADVLATAIARTRAEHALRELSKVLLHAEDDERRRIARELHDSTVQDLVAAIMNLEFIRNQNPRATDVESKQFEDSLALLENCAHEIRTLSYRLHPPRFNVASITNVIRHYVVGFGERTGLETHMELPTEPPELGNTTKMALFRVLQEALGNIHRHSKSKSATVCLTQEEGRIMLEIIDRGRGLPSHSHDSVSPRKGEGIGIASMRERVLQIGGQFEILSGAGGTTVRVKLPNRITLP